ncbi:unnamed protein product [Brassica napus]|uniref:(rape) hypothetical protein n=1 Tax=Brassica napus TaxID=3708 RepID=A0A816P1V1_BRANA|nr:unnamed protein product [Brassica napus]
MEYFPLLELPEDLQAMVVERVARNSFQDLYRLRASSRSMKALAEMRRGVQFFYSYDEQDYGLSLIKHAADAGYERAVYTHAMTQAIFYGDAQYFRRIQEQLLTGSGNLFEMRNGDGVCGILTSSVKLRPCSLLLMFRPSTFANVQMLWTDNVSAYGTLM